MVTVEEAHPYKLLEVVPLSQGGASDVALCDVCGVCVCLRGDIVCVHVCVHVCARVYIQS